MVPLVDDLVEHARVGMLRGETQAEQLQTHPGDFLDQERDVGEPPAAENVQVAKFSREDAKLVLVFPGENRAEEFVLRIGGAKVLKSGQVAQADAIAGEP